jgi:hypothetical protein
MEPLFRAFRRNADGSWTCVAPVSIDGPHCPIEIKPGSTFAPGTRVEGRDIAAWIDEHASAALWAEEKPWRKAER